MFNLTIQNPDFSKLDEAITQWWKENDIFKKSLAQTEGKEEYIFYDGPPFMSGMPHYATLLSSLPKDLIPRYQTMKGKHVERLWGWDCHGLPIENKVEKQLGLSGRKEILEYGLEPFIEKCYEWNRVGIENWRWYIEKIGRWADIDNAYRTLDQEYMESVWWAFNQLWEKGLIYKGRRTSLFSTDSSTPVSGFEVAMDPDNYRDTEDLAVTVKFKLEAGSAKKLATVAGLSEDADIFLLAWTTTPWTLPSNFALAINPDEEYVLVKVENSYVVLMKTRLEIVLDEKEYEVVASIKPLDLAGLKYVQLFPYLPGTEKDFTVYSSANVTSDEGTGILHVAPAFGEADAAMGEEWGLSFTSDIDNAGNLTVGPWQGTYIRVANPLIAEELENQGKLFKKETYVHRLPYYRYDNPLIYKTEENYFVNIQKIKQQLIDSNEEINWIPEYFKDGRFKYILETAPDWSISRSRFWGTVMPLWQSGSGKQIVVESREALMSLVNNEGQNMMQKIILSLADQDEITTGELEGKIDSGEITITVKATQTTLSGIRSKYLGETAEEAKVKLLAKDEPRSYYLYRKKPLDMHRPYIDEVKFVKDGEEYTRVAETLDVWMDSGSMPFAQFNYPFGNSEKFINNFPGDFIAEYTGQIRAWFYVLHVLANAVFDKPAFKNVSVSGVLAGTDGRKMSKSFNNYPDPKLTLEKYGAEALRMYFFSSPLLYGEDANFDEEELKAQTRDFLLPLWNSFKYLLTYANLHEWEPKEDLARNTREQSSQYPWQHMPFNDIQNELDAWILMILQQTIKSVTESLDSYNIPKAAKALKDFLPDLSKWYIRRSRNRFADGEEVVLNILYYVLVEYIKLAAPFAPFITEYMYGVLVKDKFPSLPESVHLCDYPTSDSKYMDDYGKIIPEMRLVRELSETGQMIRASKGIKVRQPLAEMVVKFKDSNLYLTEWMQRILQEELNVLEVSESADVTESDKLAIVDTTSFTAGLDLEISEELARAGLVREIVRSLQAIRKQMGLMMGEEVSISYQTESEELIKVLESNKEEIMGTISATSLEAGEADKECKINEYVMRVKVEKA